MRIAVDIDGTIARRQTEAYIRLCMREFHLLIEEEQIAHLSYQEFLHLPQVEEERKRRGEPLFTRELQWINLHPEAILAMEPMPGALKAMRRFAEMEMVTITYDTARFSMTRPERNEGMNQATRQWLEAHEFPHYQQVHFYEGPAHKLSCIAEHILNRHEPVVLIDDNPRIVDAFLQVEDQLIRKTLQDSFLLILFHNEAGRDMSGLPIGLLPEWSHTTVSRLIEQLKGFSHDTHTAEECTGHAQTY